MSEKAKEYLIAEKFIKDIPELPEPSCRAYSIQLFEEQVLQYEKEPIDEQRIIHQVCHAVMKAFKGTKVIGAGFQETNKNSYWFNVLKDHISGPESPWRSLIHNLNGIDYVSVDGKVKGWILQEDTISKVPFALIKNFTIFCRSITEHSPIYYFWWDLVQKGMSLNDALYFCAFFQNMNGVITRYGSSITTGWHYPFTHDRFDFNALRTGKLNTFEIDTVNYHFRNRACTIESYYPRADLLPKTHKSKFSTYKSYDLDEIYEDMNNWMKRNKLL